MVGREVSLDRRARGPPRRATSVLSVGRPDGRRRPRQRRRAGRARSRSAPARSSASPGVAGNGQAELVEAIVGLRRATGGSIHARRHRRHQRTRSASSPSRGIGLHPRATGSGSASCSRFPVADNLVLTDYYRPPYSPARRPQRAARSRPGRPT
ncbi:MAG: hypothetical protein MZW92_59110 [Comamonadaceae bacterium]|nr:hypothetical protein [Comamonadaceae bacterium]